MDYPKIEGIPESKTLSSILEQVTVAEAELGTQKIVRVNRAELIEMERELGGVKNFALIVSKLPCQFEVTDGVGKTPS